MTAQQLALELAQLGLELGERPACVVVWRSRHVGAERSAPSGRFRLYWYCGLNAQLQVIGTPTLTVVDPTRLFVGESFAFSV